MSSHAFDLPDADVRYVPQWLARDAADALFVALRDGIAWERHRIRMFGRDIDAPRLSCWIGDAGATYAYSRTRYAPHPWPEVLHAIRERLRSECGADFNGVLANLYRDERDSMGMHCDDEPELGLRPTIASVSLGEVRVLVFKHKRNSDLKTVRVPLISGSLLLMRGSTQANWKHGIAKESRSLGPRVNLTFRKIRMSGRA